MVLIGTIDVSVYHFVHKSGRTVYLIDTPGFDDTNRSDTEVLRDVAFFLAQIYKRKILLSGIVYLHRITDTRMAGSSVRNLEMFKALCGDDAYKHVVLATTMWGQLRKYGLSYETEVQRESELSQRPEWWGMMLRRGSKMVRHTDDRTSALAIVDYLLSLSEPTLLNIQKQMVDEGRTLEETDAGEKYQAELNELKKLHLRQIEELKDDYQQAIKERDEEVANILEEQRRELETKLNEAAEKEKDLKVTLEQLAQQKANHFGELLSQISAEQQRTASMIAKREEELKHFNDERDRERRLRQETEDRYEAQRRDLEARILSLESQRQNASAKEDRAALQKLEAQKLEFVNQQRQAEAKAEGEKRALQQRLAEAEGVRARQLQQQAAQKDSQVLVGALTGFGTMLVGAATVNPVVWAGGLGQMVRSLHG